MALHNLARVTSATTGTGTLTLGSAVSGFLTFADAGVADGEAVFYSIRDGANSEVGRGVYTASGTTLTRTTIYESTNGGSAINCSGTQEVFVTLPAESIPPGLFGSPDIAGRGGAGTSEEWDTTTTGLTWSNAPTTVDSNTTIPSHLYISNQADTTTRLGTKSWSPAGAAAFDARLGGLMFGADASKANVVGYACLHIGNSDNSLRLDISVEYNYSTGVMVVTAGTYATGSYTVRGTSTTISSSAKNLYLRITRDGSNNCSFYYSPNGVLWQFIVTQAHTLTVANIGFRIVGNATAGFQVAADWLRTNV
jgi:hypothetical protein